MGAFGGDFHIFGMDGAAIGGIQSAGGVVFGVDNYVIYMDHTLFARRKDGISAIGVGL